MSDELRERIRAATARLRRRRLRRPRRASRAAAGASSPWPRGGRRPGRGLRRAGLPDPPPARGAARHAPRPAASTPRSSRPDAGGHLRRAFDRVSLPLSWHVVEAEEATYHWGDFDPLLAWAEGHGLEVTAGPLIDFSSSQLPEWLWMWERDLPQHDHVHVPVRRGRRPPLPHAHPPLAIHRREQLGQRPRPERGGADEPDLPALRGGPRRRPVDRIDPRRQPAVGRVPDVGRADLAVHLRRQPDPLRPEPVGHQPRGRHGRHRAGQLLPRPARPVAPARPVRAARRADPGDARLPVRRRRATPTPTRR